MVVIKTKKEMSVLLNDIRMNKKSTGFVPTMGALHQGHISLTECSKLQNDITIVSIFVNPTQFNNQEDLQNYPRSLTADIEMLQRSNCDIVFTPEIDEMYPENDRRIFDFKGLDKVMEGKYRKGHFNGVAQIVSVLFEIIQPTNAYFGKKDFQQVAIIKFLNKNYLNDLNINIISCDIIRESDGLAMSSRNQLLTVEYRIAAKLISETLFKYQKNYNNFTVSRLKKNIEDEINANPLLEVEYIDIVDNDTLQSVDYIETGRTTACIAVFAGKIRLIDNISF
jgi:pantoate--beta-alanine ligase